MLAAVLLNMADTITCDKAMLYASYFMMTSSNGNIFRVTGPLCREFTGDRWIPRTKASDGELGSFSLNCAWINGWVNKRDAGDLRRQSCSLWRHCNVINSHGIKPLNDSPLYIYTCLENEVTHIGSHHSFFHNWLSQIYVVTHWSVLLLFGLGMS